MKNCRLSLIAAPLGGLVLGFSPPVLAEGTASAKALEERVEALDQKVRILERRWELEQETAAAKAKEAPVFAAGKDGFFLKSADGNFQLRFRGYLQADERFFAVLSRFQISY